MTTHIRVFTAFSGYDSQCLALDRLHNDYPDFTYELIGWSEIDKYAIIAHNALYPDAADRNYGDISKIDWEQVPDFDLFTYSFPCGLAGTKIKTLGGYRNIEDIQVGEKVLTHNNRYKEVVKIMRRIAPSHFIIQGVGCKLKLTANHPLYVLRDGKPQWVRVKELKVTDMLSYCVPNECVKSPLPDDTLWLLGRYVADGWVNPLTYHSVNFAIGKDKVEEFESHTTNLEMKKTLKSCWEYRIAHDEFQQICLGFGSGAKKKQIPKWVLDLPKEQLLVFLDGYFAGDGHIRYRSGTKQLMFSTVSKDLFLGIQQCLMKCYGKVCSLYIREDKRKATFNDTYNGQIYFTEKTIGQTKDGDMIYVKIKHIEEIKGSVAVYNMEVAEDNSYTCDNVNVHNCQDISSAGLTKGFEKGSGTRSGLLWECEKAIAAKRPAFLLMENVKNLVGKKFKPLFLEWLQLLESYGYSNYWQVLNAKDYGVPQNRERVFAVSIRGDIHQKFVFPQGWELDKTLDDVLEDEVDAKYYLSNERINGLLESTIKEMQQKNGFKFKVKKKVI